jgi:hypothetical protein
LIVIPIFLVSRSMTTNNDVKPLAPAATNPPESASPNSQSPEPAASSLPLTTTATIAAVAAAESLTVEVGKPIVKEGLLSPGQMTVFRMNLPVGQKLRATLASTPAGATMNIMAPNQANVDVFAKNTLNWEGNLPLTGEYRIEIVPLAGVASSNYKLEVATSASAPVSVATPTPTAAPINAPMPVSAPTPVSR